ncbi:hypothetical protein IJG66_00455, partial [Candidatus Saccharibacteria bacterium]|nr:hypothetical protein [Candidatus Saccharibacteria bacterium]
MAKSSTVERLKTMAKSGGKHRLRTTSRIIKYGASGYKRNIWLSIAATLVMTFTLIVVLAAGGVYLVLNSTADSMKNAVDVTIYIKPETSESTLKSMTETMKADEAVADATYYTSERNYDDLIKTDYVTKNGEGDRMTIIDTEEMMESLKRATPATIVVQPVEPDQLDSIKHIVETDEAYIQNRAKRAPTYENQESQTASKNIADWANKITIGALALAAVFLLISILAIFNTVRMAIFSRREEIYMEKLVGADNHFIRGPFLVEAMMSGVLAGILSGVLALLGWSAIASRLNTAEIDISRITAI